MTRLEKMLFPILALCGAQLGIADSISLVLISSSNGVYDYALHTPAHTILQFGFPESFFLEGVEGVTNDHASGDLASYGHCTIFVSSPPFQDIECSDGDKTFDNSASNQPRNWGDLEVDAPGTILGTATYFIEQPTNLVGSVQGPVCANVNPLNGQCLSSPIPEPTSLLLLGTGLLSVALAGLRRSSLTNRLTQQRSFRQNSAP